VRRCHGGDNRPFCGRLLTFSEAEAVAEFTGCPYEHQSDGRTLVKVGEAAVIAARRG